MKKRKTRGQRVAEQIVEHFEANTPGVSGHSWAVISVEIACAIDAAIKRAVAEERQQGACLLREMKAAVAVAGV